MALPTFNTQDLVVSQLQSTWSQALNPLLRNPANNSYILEKIPLVAGPNVVNHLLGRKLIGWRIVRQRADASIYDTQDSNNTPALTLNLVSSADAVCDIEVL
jgi:hypothetical protein